MDDSLKFDITIAGGGMVGLTMAQLIAAECPGVKLCLIEQEVFVQTDKPYQPGFDARNTALSPGSVEVFRALKVWTQMQERATAISSVQVSDKGHFGTTEFSSNEYNNQPLGYVVENAWMGRCLISALHNYKNIHTLAPARLVKISPKKSGTLLQIESAGANCEMHSDLLIIADGGNSRLRAQLGIELTMRDYKQHAVIANLECSEPHTGRAFERFTEEGPLALLPLGTNSNSHRCALIYTRPEAKLAETLALSDQQFLRQIQNAFGYRLGNFTTIGKRHAYPLSLGFANEQIRSSIVLLGNAAHFLHPVAGQGFNLALRDACQLLAALKPVCCERVSGNNAVRFGELAVLQNYISMQERDQQVTTLLSDSFNTLFSNNSKPKQVARNLGLLALDLYDGLRHEVFYRMMGESLAQAKLNIFDGRA